MNILLCIMYFSYFYLIIRHYYIPIFFSCSYCRQNVSKMYILITDNMVYLDFSKAFDKVDHGILLHKLRALGITGNIGIWLFHFLTDRSHFVRLPGVLVKTTLC